MKTVQIWCLEDGLTLNNKKYAGVNIRKHYKYLGVQVDDNFSLKKEAELLGKSNMNKLHIAPIIAKPATETIDTCTAHKAPMFQEANLDGLQRH